MLHVATVMLSGKDNVTPLALAVKVAVWAAVTAATEAVKFALEVPAGAVIVEGIVTLELLLERTMLMPAAGAADVRSTVHVDVPGALTVAGEQVNELG